MTPMDDILDLSNISGQAIHPCDKCSEMVPLDNNAILFDVILGLELPLMVYATSRHLIATERCPGSPSRAQYLEGQPRDDRAAYTRNDALVPLMRSAYARMLRFAEEHA